MHYEFEAVPWLWGGKGAWCFVTLPPETSAALKRMAGKPRGFGSVRVHVRIGEVAWTTSVFPDAKRGFVLPLKAAVRKTAGVLPGRPVAICLECAL